MGRGDRSPTGRHASRFDSGRPGGPGDRVARRPLVAPRRLFAVEARQLLADIELAARVTDLFAAVGFSWSKHLSKQGPMSPLVNQHI